MRIFEPTDWQRAEAAQGRGVARAAAAFARLDARATKGFTKRLAFSEASALLWSQGDWVPPDKIALYSLLLETPALTAGMVAAATGADKATARRNLNGFAKFGLIREITGQGRYKVWMVAWEGFQKFAKLAE